VSFIKVGDYFDNYAKIKYADGKYGFVHIYGDILPGKYAAVKSFQNGAALVQLESGRWVSINIKGEFVRSSYTHNDFLREKRREESVLRLGQIIDNTIDGMNNYMDKMFDYIDDLNRKQQKPKRY
jgi:hypothetical protein